MAQHPFMVYYGYEIHALRARLKRAQVFGVHPEAVKLLVARVEACERAKQRFDAKRAAGAIVGNETVHDLLLPQEIGALNAQTEKVNELARAARPFEAWPKHRGAGK